MLLFSATISTALWYSKAEDDVYLLKFLSLMFWGASIMVLIDHAVGYLTEGGEFIEMTPESLVLGLVMIIAALVIWEAALLIKDPKQVIHKKKT